jgi:hypothetical protein
MPQAKPDRFRAPDSRQLDIPTYSSILTVLISSTSGLSTRHLFSVPFELPKRLLVLLVISVLLPSGSFVGGVSREESAGGSSAIVSFSWRTPYAESGDPAPVTGTVVEPRGLESLLKHDNRRPIRIRNEHSGAQESQPSRYRAFVPSHEVFTIIEGE